MWNAHLLLHFVAFLVKLLPIFLTFLLGVLAPLKTTGRGYLLPLVHTNVDCFISSVKLYVPICRFLEVLTWIGGFVDNVCACVAKFTVVFPNQSRQIGHTDTHLGSVDDSTVVVLI